MKARLAVVVSTCGIGHKIPVGTIRIGYYQVTSVIVALVFSSEENNLRAIRTEENVSFGITKRIRRGNIHPIATICIHHYDMVVGIKAFEEINLVTSRVEYTRALPEGTSNIGQL